MLGGHWTGARLTGCLSEVNFPPANQRGDHKWGQPSPSERKRSKGLDCVCLRVWSCVAHIWSPPHWEQIQLPVPTGETQQKGDIKSEGHESVAKRRDYTLTQPVSPMSGIILKSSAAWHEPTMPQHISVCFQQSRNNMVCLQRPSKLTFK